jgi:hypothetical protein
MAGSSQVFSEVPRSGQSERSRPPRISWRTVFTNLFAHPWEIFREACGDPSLERSGCVADRNRVLKALNTPPSCLVCDVTNHPNHTLMQTIARANRVWQEKQNGLIVDYVGIFRNLQKALAIYGTTQTDGEMPIKDKEELVRLLIR